MAYHARDYPLNNPTMVSPSFEAQLGAMKEAEKSELKAKFDKVLDGKFDKVHQGMSFTSKLKGVKGMTVLRPEGGNQLHVYVGYDRSNGKEAGETFTIGQAGVFSGHIPNELRGLSREQLYREALTNIEQYNLSKTHQLKDEVMAPDVFPVVVGKPGASRWRHAEDPRRLAFMEAQDDFQYRFVAPASKAGGPKGMEHYHVSVFENGAALQSSYLDNAAFIVKFTKPLPPELMGEKFVRMSDQEKDEVFKKLPWPFELPIKKSELNESPAVTRFEHRAKDWESKFQALLDDTLKKKP